MKNQYGIDLNEVIKNAGSEGIDFSEISLFYSGLTQEEELELKKHNLFVVKTTGRTLGKFNPEGIALFPDKVSEVYHLGS